MTTRGAFPDLEYSFSNRCGVTLSDSVEGAAIVAVMRHKPGVEITTYPAILRIDGVGRLEFDMAEISAALGREFDCYNFQVELSTHYGKMVLLDDKVLLFANPDDATQYLAADGAWLAPYNALSHRAGDVAPATSYHVIDDNEGSRSLDKR
jgi:propane monooxygenase coupling protein